MKFSILVFTTLLTLVAASGVFADDNMRRAPRDGQPQPPTQQPPLRPIQQPPAQPPRQEQPRPQPPVHQPPPSHNEPPRYNPPPQPPHYGGDHGGNQGGWHPQPPSHNEPPHYNPPPQPPHYGGDHGYNHGRWHPAPPPPYYPPYRPIVVPPGYYPPVINPVVGRIFSTQPYCYGNQCTTLLSYDVDSRYGYDWDLVTVQSLDSPYYQDRVERVVACDQDRSLEVGWLIRGYTYVFKLYRVSYCSEYPVIPAYGVLDQTVVRGY